MSGALWCFNPICVCVKTIKQPLFTDYCFITRKESVMIPCSYSRFSKTIQFFCFFFFAQDFNMYVFEDLLSLNKGIFNMKR